MHPDLANLHTRPIMHAPDGLHRKLIKQPILDHRFAAIAPFLGRLKDKIDGTVKIARFSQILGRPQQHRAVPVMATGMHAPRRFGFVGKFIHFLHRQRIHIRPQPDGGVTVAGPSQHANNAGLAHTPMNFNPERLQLFGNKIRCQHFFIGDFRMLMKPLPPGFHIVLSVSNRIDDSHNICPPEMTRDHRCNKN